MGVEKPKVRFIESERGLIAALFVLYLVATAALTFFSFSANRDVQLAKTRSTLLTAARAGAHAIGRHFHDTYNLHHRPDPKLYRSKVMLLNSLVRDLPDVEYVYSMDVVNGQAYFIVSNETALDLTRGTPSLFYNPYNSAPPELFEAKRTGEAIFTPVYTNEWGSFRSAFVPVKRADGTTYIMAADVRADGSHALFLSSLQISALVTLLSLLPLYPLLRLYRRLQKRRESELEKELFYDPITGLPNLSCLERDLKGIHSPLNGILINLDDFHAINRLFGYDTGDRLLIQVADTISRQLPSEAVLYRSLVDEYFVLLMHTNPQHAEELTQQLIESIFEPIDAEDNRRITITARAGIALNIGNVENLLTFTREAMDQGRRLGKHLQLYSEELQPEKRYARNLHWLNTVNDAYRQGRLLPWYQPILDTRTGEISHYEALARLIDADGTIHTPFHFLPAIRKSHLYRQLTIAIIDHSFALFSTRSSSVSINLSRFDLVDRETIDYLLASASHYNMQERVIIEVLESEFIDYQDQVLQELKRCQQAGLRIAIDDFGSGYSNFDQLLKIDADYLKLDGSLVRQLGTSPKATALVQAVVSFARSLGTPLIAEYVEDQATLERLKALGIDYMQGYGIGKPAPGDQLNIR